MKHYFDIIIKYTYKWNGVHNLYIYACVRVLAEKPNQSIFSAFSQNFCRKLVVRKVKCVLFIYYQRKL